MVPGEGQRAERLAVDAEFLAQLPRERRLGGLARLDAAAGELPQPSHVPAREAAGNQDEAVIALDYRRDDEPERRCRRHLKVSAQT